MQKIITESEIEEASLEILKDLGYKIIYGPDISEGGVNEERSYNEVILVNRLRNALEAINPNIPKEAIEEVIKNVRRTESQNLVFNNQQFHRAVMNGLDIEYKRKNDSECTIGVYCVLFNENLDDVYEGTKWLRDIGVDYALFKPISQGTGNIQHIQAANLENHPTLVSDLETLQTDDFHVTVRADLIRDGYVRLGYDRCYGLPFECAIDADGSVYTCNWYWGKEEFKYGNLNDNSFPEIWESEKAKSLRSHVSSPEFKIGNCCGSCKQNSINKTLYQINHNPDKAREIEETLKSPGITPQHVNFL